MKPGVTELTEVTYEFSCFATSWYDERRKGWRFHCLGTLRFTTLAAAKREIARLKKIYAVEDKKRAKDPNRPASMLTGYQDQWPDYLRVVRVERTLL